jgi:hypothetical protein
MGLRFIPVHVQTPNSTSSSHKQHQNVAARVRLNLVRARCVSGTVSGFLGTICTEYSKDSLLTPAESTDAHLLACSL